MSAPIGFQHIGELLEKFEAELELERTSPLVRFDSMPDANGAYSVRFYDRNNPGFVYEFHCIGPADAIHWVAHLAEKQWVTTRHLELFARRATAIWTNRATGLPKEIRNA